MKMIYKATAKEVLIWSYFSSPTNLAGEVCDWQEFVSGQEYSVDLKSITTGEKVSVRLVEEWEDSYVLVSSPNSGELFDRVVGRVIFALSENTDYLQVRTSNRKVPTEPTFKTTVK